MNAQKSDRFILPLLEYWRETPVAELTAARIRAAAIDLCPSLSAATRNRQVIKTTRAIINHAAELGLCHPVKVRQFREHASRKQPTDLAWTTSFTDAAVKAGRPHQAALEWFMFLTAARIGQATRLTWGDVDLASATAILRQPKGDSDQVVHLPARLVAAIAALPGDETAGREAWRTVFGSARGETIYRHRRSTCHAARIQYLSPHCARHGFATGLLRAGVDPVTAAGLGRWKSLKIFIETYCHAIEDHALVDRLLEPPSQRQVQR